MANTTVPPTAYNTLMGLFRPQVAAPGASAYDQAVAQARSNALSQFGLGLVAAAIPQTAAQRVQSLQGTIGALQPNTTDIYNQAQARLMFQQAKKAEDEAAADAAWLETYGTPTTPTQSAPATSVTSAIPSITSAPPAGVNTPRPKPSEQVYDSYLKTQTDYLRPAQTPTGPTNIVPDQMPGAPINLANVPPQYVSAVSAGLLTPEDVNSLQYIRPSERQDFIQKRMAENAKPKDKWTPVTEEDGMLVSKNLRTGETKIVPKPESSGVSEYRKKVGEAQFTFETAGAKAGEQAARAEVLGKLLAKGQTGLIAPTRDAFVNVLKGLGVTDDQIEQMGLPKDAAISNEAARSIIFKLASSNIGPGGIPAQNFSNADLQFTLGSGPRIENLPEANAILVEIEKGKAQAAKDAYKAWNQYKKSTENPDFMEWQANYQDMLNQTGKSYFDKAQEMIDNAEAAASGDIAMGTSTPVDASGVSNGTVAVNRETGARLMFYNGNWVPMSGAGR